MKLSKEFCETCRMPLADHIRNQCPPDQAPAPTPKHPTTEEVQERIENAVRNQNNLQHVKLKTTEEGEARYGWANEFRTPNGAVWVLREEAESHFDAFVEGQEDAREDLRAQLAAAQEEVRKLRGYASQLEDAAKKCNEGYMDQIASLREENERLWAQRNEFNVRYQEAEAESTRLRELVEVAEALIKTCEENEPSFQAHVRYTYADCQKIFAPVSKAILDLDDALSRLRSGKDGGKG
jgi:chromosome segregation ATPase